LAGGGGILAVVGALTALINATVDARKELRRLAEETATLQGKRKEWLETRKAELEAEEGTGFWSIFGLEFAPEAEARRNELLKIEKELAEFRKKEAEELAKLFEVRHNSSLDMIAYETKKNQENLELEKKRTIETFKQYELSRERIKIEQSMGGGVFARPGALSGFTAGGLGLKVPVLGGIPKASDVRAASEANAAATVTDAVKGFDMLQTSALALGDTLRESLGGAFTAVFGEANSLLEKFAERLFNILGEKLILGLLSLIPGVPNLGGFILGGTKNTSAGGGEEGVRGEVVEFRIRGNGDLVAAVETGKRSLNRRAF
jgi:hypothetical protein